MRKSKKLAYKLWCDHLVGLVYYESFTECVSVSESTKPDFKFNFCPLCGGKLVKRRYNLVKGKENE